MGLGAAASGFQCDSCCVGLARSTLRYVHVPRRMDIRLLDAGVPFSPLVPQTSKSPPSVLKMSYRSEGLEVCLAPWPCILSLAVAGVQQEKGGGPMSTYSFHEAVGIWATVTRVCSQHEGQPVVRVRLVCGWVAYRRVYPYSHNRAGFPLS